LLVLAAAGEAVGEGVAEEVHDGEVRGCGMVEMWFGARNDDGLDKVLLGGVVSAAAHMQQLTHLHSSSFTQQGF